MSDRSILEGCTPSVRTRIGQLLLHKRSPVTVTTRQILPLRKLPLDSVGTAMEAYCVRMAYAAALRASGLVIRFHVSGLRRDTFIDAEHLQDFADGMVSLLNASRTELQGFTTSEIFYRTHDDFIVTARFEAGRWVMQAIPPDLPINTVSVLWHRLASEDVQALADAAIAAMAALARPS